LNFLSDSFDAAAALAQPNLPIPVARVRALDNMCKAAMLLPALQRRQVVPDERLPSRPPLSATSEVPKSSKLKVAHVCLFGFFLFVFLHHSRQACDACEGLQQNQDRSYHDRNARARQVPRRVRGHASELAAVKAQPAAAALRDA
jgi:hypothetical protein